MMDIVPLDGIDGQVVRHVGSKVLGAVGLGALVDDALLSPDQVNVVLSIALAEVHTAATSGRSGDARIIIRLSSSTVGSPTSHDFKLHQTLVSQL